MTINAFSVSSVSAFAQSRTRKLLFGYQVYHLPEFFKSQSDYRECLWTKTTETIKKPTIDLRHTPETVRRTSWSIAWSIASRRTVGSFYRRRHCRMPPSISAMKRNCRKSFSRPSQGDSSRATRCHCLEVVVSDVEVLQLDEIDKCSGIDFLDAIPDDVNLNNFSETSKRFGLDFG